VGSAIGSPDWLREWEYNPDTNFSYPVAVFAETLIGL
jgi:hypothetical protein